ncbi:hypothetical protein VPH35_133083 [Triticum aestivum]
MLALCPRLRILGLHTCAGIHRHRVAPVGLSNLRSVTIIDWICLTVVDFTVVPSLRSFRYSGGFFSSFPLPADALFADLDIRFGVQRSRNVLIRQKVFSDWFESRVCSKLATLTICSNVLFFVIFEIMDGLFTLNAILNRLCLPCLMQPHMPNRPRWGGDLFQTMTELQLLMFEMKAPELANIYVFLKKSGCSNLERLFVQPPPDVMENLEIVKIMNFSWNHFELQLFDFVENLYALHYGTEGVLITPSLEPLHVPGIQKADLLFLAEAVANGKVSLSGSDDAATQSFHSDVSADI